MKGFLLAGGVGLALLVALGVQTQRVERLKADEVTWRLAEKDYRHAVDDLNLAIKIRAGRVVARSQEEAADRGAANATCSADISSAFQKGAAVGRAMCHATSNPPPASQQPAAGVVRDYREAWSHDAYTPGS